MAHLGDHSVALECHECHRRADHDAGDDPGRARRQRRIKRRHLDRTGRKQWPYGRCRDSDHRTRQEAEKQAVGEVVDGHEVATGDFFHLVVERETFIAGDDRRQEPPGEHGQKVAQKQSEDQAGGTGPPGNEEGTDHELGAGRMFTGIHAPEGGWPLELSFGHAFAFEFRCRLRCARVGGGCVECGRGIHRLFPVTSRSYCWMGSSHSAPTGTPCSSQ